mgnify:FL=1
MPQMNKGGKFISGESEIRPDGWMQLQELHPYIQQHQPNICQISVL